MTNNVSVELTGVSANSDANILSKDDQITSIINGLITTAISSIYYSLMQYDDEYVSNHFKLIREMYSKVPGSINTVAGNHVHELNSIEGYRENINNHIKIIKNILK